VDESSDNRNDKKETPRKDEVLQAKDNDKQLAKVKDMTGKDFGDLLKKSVAEKFKQIIQNPNIFDEAGLPRNEEGNPVIKTDKNGDIIIPRDINNKPIIHVDSSGRPLPMVDKNGDTKMVTDKTGAPILPFNQDGRPVIPITSDGNA